MIISATPRIIGAIISLALCPWAHADNIADLWHASTGGAISFHGRVIYFSDKEGHTVGVTRYDPQGEIKEILSLPRKDGWDLFLRNQVYQRPNSRLARALSRLDGDQPCPNQTSPESDMVGSLIGDLELTGVKHNRCVDGDGTQRDYERFPFGVWIEEKCLYPAGVKFPKAERREILESAESEVRADLKQTLSCLMEQRPLGPSLAQRLASVILRASSKSDSSSCSKPRPLRIQCNSDLPAEEGGGTQIPGDVDYPSIRLRYGSDGYIHETFPHELMHLLGTEHGLDIDYPYAVMSCCSPASEERHGTDKHTKENACKILQGKFGNDVTSPEYLTAIRTIFDAHGRHFAFLEYSLVGLALSAPQKGREKRWSEALLIWLDTLWGDKDYELVNLLAKKELLRLPQNSPLKSEYETWSVRVPGQQGLESNVQHPQPSAQDVQKFATALMLAQSNDFSGLRKFLGHSDGGSLVDPRGNVARLLPLLGQIADDGEALIKQRAVQSE